MKRVICWICIILLICSFCGCALLKKDPAIRFYYRRSDFQYHSSEDVIVVEERELSNQSRSLYYLLPLYLMGPLDESLACPFPFGTRLNSISREDGTLILSLSNLDDSLSDVQFSLACACLALTSMEYTTETQVTIISGQRSFTISADDLVLYTDITSTINTEEVLP